MDEKMTERDVIDTFRQGHACSEPVPGAKPNKKGEVKTRDIGRGFTQVELRAMNYSKTELKTWEKNGWVKSIYVRRQQRIEKVFYVPTQNFESKPNPQSVGRTGLVRPGS